MPKPGRHKLRNLAPHPRFSGVGEPSGDGSSAEDVFRRAHGRLSRETIFPESAIRADTSVQRHGVFPEEHYVDTLKECLVCLRPFVFYAREQQYWYETLRFSIEADCVECAACRREDQRVRGRFQRYNANVVRQDPDDRAFATLLEDTVFLWRAGVMNDEQRLRTLRNRARRLPPGGPALDSALAEVDRLIADLESPCGRFRRYSRSVTLAKWNLDTAAFRALVEDAVCLHRAGALNNTRRLRILRNQSRNWLPGTAALAEIERLVDELDGKAASRVV